MSPTSRALVGLSATAADGNPGADDAAINSHQRWGLLGQHCLRQLLRATWNPDLSRRAQIGVNCAVVFAPSPLSAKSHAIFEVAVPLVVTMTTDPLYFSNPISNVNVVPSRPATPASLPRPLAPLKLLSWELTETLLESGPPPCRYGAPPAAGAATAYRALRQPPGRQRQRAGPRSRSRGVLCHLDGRVRRSSRRQFLRPLRARVRSEHGRGRPARGDCHPA